MWQPTQCSSTTLFTLMYKSTTYHIAENTGGELNLANWRFWKQATKLKSANIQFAHSKSVNCVVYVRKDGLKIYHAFVTSKEVALRFVHQRSHLFTDEEFQCVNKKWKVYYKKRPQARTNVVESIMTTYQSRDDHVESANTQKKLSISILFHFLQNRQIKFLPIWNSSYMVVYLYLYVV